MEGERFHWLRPVSLVVAAINFSSRVYAPNLTPTYQWDFGNGNSAVTANPEAIFTDVGTYTVTLTVIAGGQIAKATHTVTVYPAPTADRAEAVLNDLAQARANTAPAPAPAALASAPQAMPPAAR